MKLQRPGYTESGLCFLDYLNKHYSKNDNEYKIFLLKWLFSTSGYYDHSIKSYKCNFNVDKFHPRHCQINLDDVLSSDTYNKWLQMYSASLFKSEHLIFCLHNHKKSQYRDFLQKYLDSLKPKQNVQYKHFWTWHKNIYDLLKQKNVLIINDLADIIHTYYKEGKTHSVYAQFPTMNTIALKTKCSFFNTGPHDNCIETLNIIYEKITSINFDIALISYGSYGCILADRINKNLNKNAITIGSGLPKLFGVENISLPPSELPQYNNIIENGRYWNFNEKT